MPAETAQGKKQLFFYHNAGGYAESAAKVGPLLKRADNLLINCEARRAGCPFSIQTVSGSLHGHPASVFFASLAEADAWLWFVINLSGIIYTKYGYLLFNSDYELVDCFARIYFIIDTFPFFAQRSVRVSDTPVIQIITTIAIRDYRWEDIQYRSADKDTRK